MLMDKYVRKMSNERFAYVYTVIELVKRGKTYKEAREMIKKSYLMERLRMDHVFFFHYAEDQWADWVIEDCEHLDRLMAEEPAEIREVVGA